MAFNRTKFECTFVCVCVSLHVAGCVVAMSGWLEPLLDRIALDPSTVVCPVIDVIDDSTLEYHWRDSGGVNVGGFDWNLQVTAGPLTPVDVSVLDKHSYVFYKYCFSIQVVFM